MDNIEAKCRVKKVFVDIPFEVFESHGEWVSYCPLFDICESAYSEDKVSEKMKFKIISKVNKSSSEV